MLLWVLFLILVVLLGISLYVFKKDLVHPTVVFCLMFLASVVCALVNADTWHLELHDNTFYILVGMAILFVAASIFIKLYYKKSGKLDKIKKYIPSEIKVGKVKLALVVLFDIVYIVLLVKAISDIASEFGDYNSYSQILNAYKANAVYKANASLPKYITFASKFVLTFAYVFMFIGVNNLFTSGELLRIKIKKNWPYFLPAALYSISLLLQSSRGSVIRLILAGAIIGVILYYKKNAYKINFSIRKILIACIVGATCLFGFYSLSSIVGRDTLGKNSLEYITMYVGGSIENFDLYMQDAPKKSELLGRETFWGSWRFLADYGIINQKEIPTGSLEWRKVDGTTTGNVYTAYRRWIQDFGVIGCAVVTVFVCLLYNVFYYKLLCCKVKRKNFFNLALIIYGIIFYHLALISIDCRIFDEIIPASLVQYIVLVGVYYFCVGDCRKGISKRICRR